MSKGHGAVQRYVLDRLGQQEDQEAFVSVFPLAEGYAGNTGRSAVESIRRACRGLAQERLVEWGYWLADDAWSRGVRLMPTAGAAFEGHRAWLEQAIPELEAEAARRRMMAERNRGAPWDNGYEAMWAAQAQATAEKYRDQLAAMAGSKC